MFRKGKVSIRFIQYIFKRDIARERKIEIGRERMIEIERKKESVRERRRKESKKRKSKICVCVFDFEELRFASVSV